MPYVYETSGRGPRLLAPPLLAAAGLALTVAFAAKAQNPQIRFAFYFLSGIFGMGFYHAVRRLVAASPTHLQIDAEKIAWRAGTEAEVLAWAEVTRCMLVDVETVADLPSIRLKTETADFRRVPAACLPPALDDIARVLRNEVLPRHPHLRASRNETDLRPDDPASAG